MENMKSMRQVRLWQIYQNSYLSYFLMYNFYYLSWALFSALISVYLMNMGFRASDVSLVVSASFLTSLLTQPMIGKWNDQYDMKIVNTILFVIAIIGAILFMLSHHLIMIMLSYSIVLMMINGVNPIMEKIATASPYQYGKIRIWGTIGYALGSGMAGFLYEHIAPEAIFIVFIFTMSLCILGLLGTKPKQVEKKAENKVLQHKQQRNHHDIGAVKRKTGKEHERADNEAADDIEHYNAAVIELFLKLRDQKICKEAEYRAGQVYPKHGGAEVEHLRIIVGLKNPCKAGERAKHIAEDYQHQRLVFEHHLEAVNNRRLLYGLNNALLGFKAGKRKQRHTESAGNNGMDQEIVGKAELTHAVVCEIHHNLQNGC